MILRQKAEELFEPGNRQLIPTIAIGGRLDIMLNTLALGMRDRY